jgi:hypothetical protein
LDSLLISRGEDANLNKLGVTLLTLSSVHCADSKTATNRVKLSE